MSKVKAKSITANPILARSIAARLIGVDSSGPVPPPPPPPTPPNYDPEVGTPVTFFNSAMESTISVVYMADVDKYLILGCDDLAGASNGRIRACVGTVVNDVLTLGSTITINSTQGGGANAEYDSTSGKAFVVYRPEDVPSRFGARGFYVDISEAGVITTGSEIELAPTDSSAGGQAVVNCPSGQGGVIAHWEENNVWKAAKVYNSSGNNATKGATVTLEPAGFSFSQQFQGAYDASSDRVVLGAKQDTPTASMRLKLVDASVGTTLSVVDTKETTEGNVLAASMAYHSTQEKVCLAAALASNANRTQFWVMSTTATEITIESSQNFDEQLGTLPGTFRALSYSPILDALVHCVFFNGPQLSVITIIGDAVYCTDPVQMATDVWAATDGLGITAVGNDLVVAARDESNGNIGKAAAAQFFKEADLGRFTTTTLREFVSRTTATDIRIRPIINNKLQVPVAKTINAATQSDRALAGYKDMIYDLRWRDNSFQAWRYDLQTQDIVLHQELPVSGLGSNDFTRPKISHDGKYVTFERQAGQAGDRVAPFEVNPENGDIVRWMGEPPISGTNQILGFSMNADGTGAIWSQDTALYYGGLSWDGTSWGTKSVGALAGLFGAGADCSPVNPNLGVIGFANYIHFVDPASPTVALIQSISISSRAPAAIRFSPNGQYIAITTSGSTDYIQIWSAITRSVIVEIESPIAFPLYECFWLNNNFIVFYGQGTSYYYSWNGSKLRLEQTGSV